MLVVVASTYSLCLFVWWWLKVKRATKVYSYITFLYLALSIGSINHVFFKNHFIHHTIPVLLLIAIVPVAARMTKRVWMLAKGTEEEIKESLKVERCPTTSDYCSRLALWRKEHGHSDNTSS